MNMTRPTGSRADRIENEGGARGFESLRYWLYLSCVTDIVKLTLDTRKESANIQNIITGLSQSAVCQEVKERTRTN